MCCWEKFWNGLNGKASGKAGYLTTFCVCILLGQSFTCGKTIFTFGHFAISNFYQTFFIYFIYFSLHISVDKHIYIINFILFFSLIYSKKKL